MAASVSSIKLEIKSSYSPIESSFTEIVTICYCALLSVYCFLKETNVGHSLQLIVE